MLKSFVSLPNAAQLVALLLVGWLSAKIGKRNLLALSSILFAISGILPIFVKDFTIILIGRLLLGFSVGLAQPLGTALLADFYNDKERNTLMGYQSSLSGFGNMFLTFIAGLFIASSWRWGFIVYLLGLVIFAMLWLFVPNDRVVLGDNDAYSIKKKEHVNAKEVVKSIIWWAVAMFLFNMAYSSGILDFNLTVVETKAGSATDAANIVAATSIVGIIAGLIFGKYVQLTKKFAGILAVALMLIGNVILAIGNTLIIFIIAYALIALGFGLFMPYIMTAVNQKSTKTTSALITGLTLSAGSIANFTSTYFYAGFSHIFGKTNSQFEFYFGALCCLILIIELFGMKAKKLL